MQPLTITATITVEEFITIFTSNFTSDETERFNKRAKTFVAVSDLKPPQLPQEHISFPIDAILPFEDFVQKKSHNFFKSWSQRFLAIEATYNLKECTSVCTLTFYADKKKKKFNRQIAFEEIDFVQVIENTTTNKGRFKPGAFEIKCLNGELYESCAEGDPKELDKKGKVWVQTIVTHMLVDAIIRKAPFKRIKALVDSGANVNKDVEADKQFFPLVYLALKNYGTFEVAQYLIMNGANYKPLLRWHFLDVEKTYTASLLLELLLASSVQLDVISDDFEFNILHYLVYQGDINAVKKALDHMSAEDISRSNKFNDSALHLAIKVNSKFTIEIAKLLIPKSDLNKKDKGGDTAIHLSLKRRCDELSSIMIEQGSNLNVPDSEGNNALHIAIKLELKNLAKKMIATPGVKLDSRETACKDSSLAIAMKLEAHDIACALILKGADPNVGSGDWKIPGCESDLPVHVAIKLKYAVVASQLIESGADLLKRDSKGFNPLHLCLQSKQYVLAEQICKTKNASQIVNMNDTLNSETSFLMAIESGHLPLAGIMLKKGANPNVVNVHGEAALHKFFRMKGNVMSGKLKFEAPSASKDGECDGESGNQGEGIGIVSAPRSSDYSQFLDDLLFHGANLRAVTGSTVNGLVADPALAGLMSPLHICTLLGDAVLSFASQMIIKDVSIVALKNEIGETPLTIAIQNDYTALANAYIAASTKDKGQPLSFDYFNKNGDSPLHLACRKKSVQILSQLLEAGAYSMLWDTLGRCPLHIAVEANFHEAVDILKSSGSNLDVRTEEGLTPLMIAVMKNKPAVIKRLLNYSIDLKLRLPRSRKSLLHLTAEQAGFPKGPCSVDYLPVVNMILGIASDIELPLIPLPNALAAENDIISYLKSVEGVKAEKRASLRDANVVKVTLGTALSGLKGKRENGTTSKESGEGIDEKDTGAESDDELEAAHAYSVTPISSKESPSTPPVSTYDNSRLPVSSESKRDLISGNMKALTAATGKLVSLATPNVTPAASKPPLAGTTAKRDSRSSSPAPTSANISADASPVSDMTKDILSARESLKPRTSSNSTPVSAIAPNNPLSAAVLAAAVSLKPISETKGASARDLQSLLETRRNSFKDKKDPIIVSSAIDRAPSPQLSAPFRIPTPPLTAPVRAPTPPVSSALDSNAVSLNTTSVDLNSEPVSLNTSVSSETVVSFEIPLPPAGLPPNPSESSVSSVVVVAPLSVETNTSKLIVEVHDTLVDSKANASAVVVPTMSGEKGGDVVEDFDMPSPSPTMLGDTRKSRGLTNASDDLGGRVLSLSELEIDADAQDVSLSDIEVKTPMRGDISSEFYQTAASSLSAPPLESVVNNIADGAFLLGVPPPKTPPPQAPAHRRGSSTVSVSSAPEAAALAPAPAVEGSTSSRDLNSLLKARRESFKAVSASEGSVVAARAAVPTPPEIPRVVVIAPAPAANRFAAITAVAKKIQEENKSNPNSDEDEDGELSPGPSSPASSEFRDSSFIDASSPTADFEENVRSMTTRSELEKALENLDLVEKSASENAKQHVIEAAAEWLKLPTGKKIVKRDARKIIKELEGKETLSSKEAKARAKAAFIQKATSETTEEVRLFYAQRRAFIQNQLDSKLL
jgi:ankyrin repeat protein